MVPSFPVISNGEFTRRIENFKQKMQAGNIDLVIIYSNLLDPSGVRYFSDFSAMVARML